MIDLTVTSKERVEPLETFITAASASMTHGSSHSETTSTTSYVEFATPFRTTYRTIGKDKQNVSGQGELRRDDSLHRFVSQTGTKYDRR